MKPISSLTRFALTAFLLTATGLGVAQGPPGHDPNNPPPGHGGVPPGQAKKHGGDDDQGNPGHGGVPPGQAKKYRDDYHFQGDDRDRFYAHYRSDADQWKHRKRPVFVKGRGIPKEYVIQPVPQSYWVGAPLPPLGYQYGYYGGYVVAYNPSTRIVADVLDLVVTVNVR